MARLEGENVWRLAVSNDGNWIAAGTVDRVSIWDANTYKQKQVWKNGSFGLDFSPDSTQLVTASFDSTIWDIVTGKQIRRLDRSGHQVLAAKYSPQGDQIATVTIQTVRVWDSHDGHLLADIPVQVTLPLNTGLVWFNNHFFVTSGNSIKKIEATSVSEWPVPVPNSDETSCAALQNRGEFIACATRRVVTFWDMSTHAQVGLVQHHQNIKSIALSSDDRLIAIAGADGKITIKLLSRISVSILSLDHCAFELLRSAFSIYLTDHATHFRCQSSRLTMPHLVCGRMRNLQTWMHC